ncbi:MAG: 26 kDa periplasmic immunogenic protein [Candidatus Wolfebacteria bacterium GW2011_GWA1_47_6]|nr:MAG: 26 kDa periplasmic immunogenic protein [Candidatus Wolfebacteria bacterium GW2011_GWA1_47_6]
MDTKIKNSLSAIGVIAITLLTYAGFIYARAYAESIQPSSFRSFAVSGEGKVTAIPDIAQFNFGVVTQGGKDITESQEQNAEKMNAIISFIKSQGVDVKDIKTQQFSIDPRYQYYDCSSRSLTPTTMEVRPCPPPDIVGYTITQSATVKIRDFAKIGDIMGTLTETEAREAAIKQAQEKAKAIAKSGDFGIGKLLSIDESGGQIPYYAYGRGGDMLKTSSMEMATPIAPSIEPGSQEVNINVTLRYEIR